MEVLDIDQLLVEDPYCLLKNFRIDRGDCRLYYRPCIKENI